MDKKMLTPTDKRTPQITWRLHEDTPLGARLRSLFDGANNSEIARKLGVHNSTIHTIAITGTISDRMFNKVTSYTGCNPDWLRNGKGNIYRLS